MRQVFLAVFIIFFLFHLPLSAAEYNSDEIPEGMELIEIGQTRVLVPKGSKVDKRGGLVLLENVDDYVARTISDLENRITSLESRLQAMEEKIGKLSEVIAEFKDSSLTSSEKRK
jgi:hypothetical protein